jgi:outer membrane lipoprotein-sorting protein
MSVFDRRPGLRWAVPVGVGILVAAGAVMGTAQVSASSGLPPLTPAQLLTELQGASPQAFSGTVEVSADLGLPDLSLLSGQGGTDLAGLVTGTHTLRVWSDGADAGRIDLLSTRSEYDVIRNGTDVWLWDSSNAAAEHAVLPSGKADMPLGGAAMPTTPQQATDLVLSRLDATTDVSVSGAATVAGRPAYELSLAPTQSGTTIARVVIAVDAETSMPLRVQVFSTRTQAPAFSVGFTEVDMTSPAASVFDFAPPPGATVTERDADGPKASTDSEAPTGTVVGTAWTTVIVARTDALAKSGQDAGLPAQLLATLPTIDGTWGTGRVLDGTLLSAIVTDDGRIAIGAVTPDLLGAALASR